MKKFLFKNWKTNLLSILALVILGLYIANIITTEQLISIQGFIIALGLFSSKDACVKNGNGKEGP